MENTIEIEPGERLIRIDEVVEIVPYSRMHLYRLMHAGKFPRQVRLGGNRVAWLESEVMKWVAARVAERDAAA